MRGLAGILQNPAVWRGDACPRMPQAGLPSGFADLDTELPADGWPTAKLLEQMK